MWLILIALLCTSCSTIVSERHEYVYAYQAGNLDSAQEKVTELLARKSRNDEVWLRLDRAMTEFAQNNTRDANYDFKQALETLDFYNRTGFMETLGQSLFYDGAAPWRGDDYEQLLARIYFALCLIHEGDESNAFAMLRQAEEWTQDKQEEYRKSKVTTEFTLTENKLGKYLFALMLQKKGDPGYAAKLFEQIGLIPPSLDATHVIVLCHNGQMPYKYTTFSKASQASMLALEMLLGANRHNTFSISTLAGIPVPELSYWPKVCPLKTTARLDGELKILTPFFYMDQAAREELEQKRPVLIARGVARLGIRRGLVAACEEKDPALGQLIDIGMLIANCCTEADIRSWTLLPQQWDLCTFEACPGRHTFECEMVLANFQKKTFRANLELKKGSICIIHLFNNTFNPTLGMPQVLIPQRFQETL